MLAIKAHFKGRGVFAGLKGRREDVLLFEDGSPLQLALFDKPDDKDGPAVVLRLDLPDGRTVIAATSLALLANAVTALSSAAALPALSRN